MNLRRNLLSGPNRGSLAALAAVLVCSLAAAAQEPMRLLTKEQMRDFLLNAKILKGKDIGKGVTRPQRLTLSDGTFTHDAAFSTVDERQGTMRFASGKMELNFVDSYTYTVAAYQLAELLEIDDMMPVTVERTWKGQKGSLVWWVDDKLMDEGDRLKNKVTPPNPEHWNQQMYRMRVFAQLVHDTDRNVGNVVISKDWKLWMIDFTRAFRLMDKLAAPGDLTKIDRTLFAKLRTLTPETILAKTKPFLTPSEVKPLLARRDLIIAHFEKLIGERGEDRVVYDYVPRKMTLQILPFAESLMYSEPSGPSAVADGR